MKAFLINSYDETITEVDYDGDYTNITKLISTAENEVNMFDAVRVGPAEDVIFVGDEALLKGPTTFFKHASCPSPLAGNGLVLGTNQEGESVAPTATLEDLRASIQWAMPVRVGTQVAWLFDPVEA